MEGVFERFRERQATRDLEPLGVIDIGSNSVRLVIYEGAVRAAAPLFNEKVLCGLGRQVATTGQLGGQAVARALAALVRFRAIARILGVKNLRAIATAAVRDAEDGAEFIRRGEDVCGTTIDVLSGAREAELVAQGIRMGFTTPGGLSGDLGGGSLELTDVAGDDLLHSITAPLGGLRLIDETGGKIEQAANLIDAELDKIDWLENGKGRPFYAVGGTWRAMAKVHMEATNYPLRVMHGYAMPTSEAILFCSELRKSKKLLTFDGIQAASRSRREVLPFGALVLEKVLKRVEPSEVLLSVFGIREGILYSLLPGFEQHKDPLLCFCENFARIRSRSLQHAHELYAWTDAIFMKADLRETAEERRLRHAACLISDIGWRAQSDYRGELSLNVIAHAGMSGIDHAGRIFLALSIYYRHVGVSARKEVELALRLKSQLSKKSEKRARIIGAAIRCAHMLSIGMQGIIDETPLSFEDESVLVLKLPKVYGGLDGERLRRRLDTLGNLIGCKAKVSIA